MQKEEHAYEVCYEVEISCIGPSFTQGLWCMLEYLDSKYVALKGDVGFGVKDIGDVDRDGG